VNGGRKGGARFHHSRAKTADRPHSKRTRRDSEALPELAAQHGLSVEQVRKIAKNLVDAGLIRAAKAWIR
jgi:hypothetical protein